MKAMDRRTFLKLAGAGSAVAATAALPVAALSFKESGSRLSFKATAGLPARPLPAYATNVVEGNVDLTRGSGIITSQVFAGHTEGVSDIALPGTSRVIRVIDAVQDGGTTRLTGVIDDRSTLMNGERARVEIVIDQARGVVWAPFIGRQIELNLAS